MTGAAVLKNSKHKADSVEFINWSLSTKTAKYMEENNFTYMFTNPEMDEPKDSMGQDLVLWL